MNRPQSNPIPVQSSVPCPLTSLDLVTLLKSAHAPDVELLMVAMGADGYVTSESRVSRSAALVSFVAKAGKFLECFEASQTCLSNWSQCQEKWREQAWPKIQNEIILKLQSLPNLSSLALAYGSSLPPLASERGMPNTAAEVVAKLMDWPPQPDKSHPFLTFMGRITGQFPIEEQPHWQSLMHRFALLHELPYSPLSPTSEGVALSPQYLTFIFQPASTSERYRITLLKTAQGRVHNEGVLERGSEREQAKRWVRKQLERIVQQEEAPEGRVIEFVVPRNLMMEPFDQWEFQTDNLGDGTLFKLGREYPVVLRAWERSPLSAKNAHLLSRWLGRRQATQVHHWEGWAATDAPLASAVCCLVLRFCLHSLADCTSLWNYLLREGLPFALWSHQPYHTLSEGGDKMKQWCSQHLAQSSQNLPQQVWAERRRLDSPLRDCLSLLWDDPNREVILPTALGVRTKGGE